MYGYTSSHASAGASIPASPPAAPSSTSDDSSGSGTADTEFRVTVTAPDHQRCDAPSQTNPNPNPCEDSNAQRAAIFLSGNQLERANLHAYNLYVHMAHRGLKHD